MCTCHGTSAVCVKYRTEIKKIYGKEILELYFLNCVYGVNNISVYICVPFIQEAGAQHGNGCFLLETSAKT